MNDDNVYRERAALVAHLAAVYPSVLAYNDPQEPEWPLVYVTTPQGQLSWHLAPTDLDLFGHVPVVEPDQVIWDGHDTPEKYRRLAALTAGHAVASAFAVGGIVSPLVEPDADCPSRLCAPAAPPEEDEWTVGDRVTAWPVTARAGNGPPQSGYLVFRDPDGDARISAVEYDDEPKPEPEFVITSYSGGE